MSTVPDEDAAKVEAAVKFWRETVHMARQMKWADSTEQQLVLAGLEAKKAKAEQDLARLYPSVAEDFINAVGDLVEEFKHRRAEELAQEEHS